MPSVLVSAIVRAARLLFAMSMLNLVSAHNKFLIAAKGNMPSEGFDPLREAHARAVCESMRNLGTVTLSDAADVMSALPQTIFGPAGQKDIADTINALLASGSLAAATIDTAERAMLRPQEHFYLHKYLTEREWSLLLSRDTSIESKLHLVAQRCKSLGLYSASEKTAVAISAMVIYANGKPCDHTEAFDVLHKFKMEMKRVRLGRAASDLVGPKIYPADPQEFLKGRSSPYAAGDRFLNTYS